VHRDDLDAPPATAGELARLARLLGLEDVTVRARGVVDGDHLGWRIRLDGDLAPPRWAGGLEIRAYDGPPRPYVSAIVDRPGVTLVLDGGELPAVGTVAVALRAESSLAQRARQLGARFHAAGREVVVTALATGEIAAVVRPGVTRVDEPPLGALVALCVELLEACDRAGVPVRTLAVPGDAPSPAAPHQ
jgi:hypothetical protein